ncbi:hypothetical protein IE53DRAFT_323196 [Violaceomyces palustris]|uniref:Uncharacterized protein n=1 Tax=Violaceomyces palustris TaxID=1673888 RepID=A0ACD0P8P6_9BASI|nr:hypothetical protein IE53DRAFT_323196 [Violaceomyces palustris]
MAAPPPSAADQEEQIRMQSFYLENVGHNARQTYYVRSTSLSVAGSVAGVLGLTNFSGFYFYLFSLLLVNGCILLINAKAQPSKYFIAGPKQSGASSRLGSSSVGDQGVDSKRRSTIRPKSLGGGGGGNVLTALDLAKLTVEGAQDNAFSYVLWRSSLRLKLCVLCHFVNKGSLGSMGGMEHSSKRPILTSTLHSMTSNAVNSSS